MNEKMKRKLRKLHDKSAEKVWKKRAFYELKSLMGYDWAIFYILLGSRQAGKSYAIADFYVNQFVNKGRPFYWIRLTERSAGKLLMNNAEKLIDPDIRLRYGLDLETIGNHVYQVTKRGPEDKDGNPGKVIEKKLMCTVMALNTFYNDKGSAYYDKDFLNDPNAYYNIVLDEMNRELNEKKTFDIAYSFVNQIENLVRETQYNIRVVMIGNTLEEASDLLCLFNFIPETFGRFKLVKNKKILVKFLNEMKHTKSTAQRREVYERYQKYDFGMRAIIENMEPTEQYQVRRKHSIANILMGNESTFSNSIKTDDKLVTKRPIVKPSVIIKFTKEEKDWFTIWDDKVVCKYNKEQIHNVIAMRPYIDEDYSVELVKNVFEWFHLQTLMYRNLITFKLFEKNLSSLKPKG